MENNKVLRWEVTLLDNKHSKLVQDVKLFNTDTKGYLEFVVMDEDFAVDSAEITLVNLDDDSTIQKDTIISDNLISYHLERLELSHAGNWIAQLVIYSDGERYTTQTVHFPVGGHIVDGQPIGIDIIQDWETLQEQVLEMVADIEGLEAIVGPEGPEGPPGRDGKDGRDGLQGPEGPPGPEGPEGPQGVPGKGIDYSDLSPEEIAEITGPEGPEGKQGPQGVPGEDGYTPIKGVDYFDGEQGPEGPQGVPGRDGKDGLDGEDGYTPVKGVDYFDGEQGPEGPQGEPGQDAELTEANVIEAIGYTPLSKDGGTLETYTEATSEVSGTSLIDLTEGNVFIDTPTTNRTYSITGSKAGVAHSFTLQVVMGSAVTLTFPASVKWHGGEVPDLSEADKTYILTFLSTDGGTTWFGMLGGAF